MPFEFVDNTAIDRAARKRIRSHVAMGKNAGKTLARASRNKAVKLRVEPAMGLVHIIPKSSEAVHDLDRREDMAPQLERQIGDSLSVFPFPEQLTPKSRGLVERALSFISGPRSTPELRNAIETSDTSSSMFVQFMFLDKAYFHCAVAVSVIALNNLVAKQEDPIEAMRHLSHTFRLVNERLSGNEPVSDETLAVVINMTHYERLQGNYHQVIFHLEGLQRMVELRGGISQVKNHLARKIFRADLEYSLYQGTATRYSLKDVVRSSTPVVGTFINFGNQDKQKLSKVLNSRLFRHLNTDIQSLLIDITCLAWLLNDAAVGHRPKLNGDRLHETLLVLGYRLVHVSPLGGPRPTSHLENSIHLGLTAFLMTFLPGLDHRIINTPLLSHLARSAFQKLFDNDQETQEMLLWLLFIGGASVFREPNDAWLIPKTALVLQALDLHTWKDVHRTLAKFPWVDAVHYNPGKWHWPSSWYKPLAEVTSA